MTRQEFMARLLALGVPRFYSPPMHDAPLHVRVNLYVDGREIARQVNRRNRGDGR